MDPIIEQAEKLGKAIAQSPAAAKLRAARKEVNGDAELSRLLKDYQAQSEKIARLEQDNQPVEVEEKRKLKALEEKLLASQQFKNLTAAQMDYVDLMRKVNSALRQQLNEVEGEGDQNARPPA